MVFENLKQWESLPTLAWTSLAKKFSHTIFFNEFFDEIEQLVTFSTLLKTLTSPIQIEANDIHKAFVG